MQVFLPKRSDLRKRDASASKNHFWEIFNSIIYFEYMQLPFTVQNSRKRFRKLAFEREVKEMEQYRSAYI